LKGCLWRFEEQRMPAGSNWKSAVYRRVQEEVKADRGLTIGRMVELGRVFRSGFYRFDGAESGPDRDMKLRDAIQRRSPWNDPAMVVLASPN